MTLEKHPPAEEDVELRPDGWERFTFAVKAAVKNGPVHRTSEARKPFQPDAEVDAGLKRQ
jgi:hypothetical protein